MTESKREKMYNAYLFNANKIDTVLSAPIVDGGAFHILPLSDHLSEHGEFGLLGYDTEDGWLIWRGDEIYVIPDDGARKWILRFYDGETLDRWWPKPPVGEPRDLHRLLFH